MATALLLLALAASPAGAELYTWTDEKGVTHMSSKPPAANAVKKDFQTIATPKRPPPRPPAPPEKPPAKAAPAPAAPAPAPAAAANAAKAAPKIELYTTSWCGACSAARAYLNARGAPFQEYDIEKDEQAMTRFQGYGGRGVPLAVIDGSVVRGFSQSAFDALIKR